jgi:hypothetical protein
MGNRAISDDQIFRLSKLFHGVIDHHAAGCTSGGGIVGALGFRVGPVQVSIDGLGGSVENNIGTTFQRLASLIKDWNF